MRLIWTSRIRELPRKLVLTTSVASFLFGYLLPALWNAALALDWSSHLAPAWVQAIGSVAGILIAVVLARLSSESQRVTSILKEKAVEKASYQSMMQLTIRVQDMADEVVQWSITDSPGAWKNRKHYDMSIDFLLAALERRMEGERSYGSWFACLEIHENLRDLKSMISQLGERHPIVIKHAVVIRDIAQGHHDACLEDYMLLTDAV